ncbi:MAG: peroxidase-related enzyme [Geminicoccaceae bacterium]|nr:peroxidase-related enzyme [Geminicoccaceae bacterium]
MPRAERVSSFDVPALDDLPADVRDRIDEVAAKSGFIPNVFLALSRRPAEFRAFFAYYDALMLREGGLTKAEKEMIVVVTSAANQCPYCVVAHGALLRIFAKDPMLGDRLATNWRKAGLPQRQQVMLEASLKLARTPELFGEADVQALEQQGFDQEDIWDIGAITALFALSNRMAQLSDMQPNAEFFMLGRER